MKVFDWMTSCAGAYRCLAIESVNLNENMNELKGDCELTQKQVDALLVDFVNFCARMQGVDYALCTKDF